LSIGTIAVTPNSNPTSEFLAKFSIDSIMARIKLPVAYAASIQMENLTIDDRWEFQIDNTALTPLTRERFNRTNYELRHVEINPPDEGLIRDLDSPMPSSYRVFDRYEEQDTSIVQDGILPARSAAGGSGVTFSS